MLETRKQRVASRGRFARRMGVTLLIAVGVLLVALGIGVLGYHHFAGFGWVDSLLNAPMILTGMGPVGSLSNNTAKVFASVYALFSGLVAITVMGMVLAPLAHRALHLFHLDEEDTQS